MPCLLNSLIALVLTLWALIGYAWLLLYPWAGRRWWQILLAGPLVWGVLLHAYLRPGGHEWW